MFEDAVGIVSIFSFYGRIGRLRYLAYSAASLLLSLLLYSVIVGLLYLFVPPQIGIVLAGVVFALIMLVWLFFNLMFSAQRCHDVNFPAWTALIILIPFGQLLLLLMPGTVGDNNYGSQPVPNSRGVMLSLISLPIVIVVIVVLSVIAMPAYQTFVQQANSLEPIEADLIPTPAPQVKPAPQVNAAPQVNKQAAAKPAETPGTQSTTVAATNTPPGGTASPDVPFNKLAGVLSGRAFTPDKASIKQGILEIRQGSDFFADLKIVIFTGLKAPYDGRILKVTTATGFGTPQLHIGIRRNKDQPVPETEIVMKDYYMYLEFGKEKDFSIPIKLILKTAANEKINVSGRMQVATSGLQASEGVINRQHDSLDTIKYIGQEYIRQRHQGSKITFSKPRRLMMQNASRTSNQPVANEDRQQAEYAVSYHLDDGPQQLARLQYLKTENGWQVVQQLQKNEMFDAHPLHEKDWLKLPGLAGPRVLAARHFELNKFRKYNWQEISEPGFNCGGKVGNGISYCEVKYKLTATDQTCHIDTYVFDKKYDQWRIKQILPTDKKFSVREGRVVARKQTNMLCF